MEKKRKFWKSESRQISFLVSRISSHVESRSFVPLRFSLTRLSVKLCFFACCTASYETWIFTSEMVAWRYNKISRPYLSRSWTRRNTPQKRNSASLFARGHDGMRPRRRLKNLAEWSAVKFETRWRFRLSWPKIAQIKSHFRFRGAKPLARVKLSRFHSSIRRPFFLPLIVSLFLNDRK